MQDWGRKRKQNEAGPPEFPHCLIPVLELDDGSGTVLSETPAILRYASTVLSSSHVRDPVGEAQLDALMTAAIGTTLTWVRPAMETEVRVRFSTRTDRPGVGSRA